MPLTRNATRLVYSSLTTLALVLGLGLAAPVHADEFFGYRDKRGDAPKGFDILRGNGQITNNTLYLNLRVRGLKRFGTVQVITDSDYEQNSIFIQNAGDGPYVSASWHRSAVNIMAGWKMFETCAGGTLRWTPGRIGTINVAIKLDGCGVSPPNAVASTRLAFVKLSGFGPRRQDVLGSIPGSGDFS